MNSRLKLEYQTLKILFRIAIIYSLHNCTAFSSKMNIVLELLFDKINLILQWRILIYFKICFFY